MITKLSFQLRSMISAFCFLKVTSLLYFKMAQAIELSSHFLVPIISVSKYHMISILEKCQSGLICYKILICNFCMDLTDFGGTDRWINITKVMY